MGLRASPITSLKNFILDLKVKIFIIFFTVSLIVSISVYKLCYAINYGIIFKFENVIN